MAEMKHPAQVVALCGRNEKLQKKLEKLSEKISQADRVVIKPIGFTKEMDEYMSASDIILGKPGGLTTSEALAKGLVFAIVNPIPGQEERNSDHLLEEMVAIRCNNLPTLAYKIDNLLDDSERFKMMQTNSLRLSKPNAAFDVVQKLLTL
jgi:processive 1,2-diacylglycerol beta-glucosyltransferase